MPIAAVDEEEFWSLGPSGQTFLIQESLEPPPLDNNFGEEKGDLFGGSHCWYTYNTLGMVKIQNCQY